MASTKYFNPIPLFILFRETIEASIVVSVLLTFLNRCAPELKRQVWWGVGFGVGASLILAAIFAILYYEFQNNVFQGKNQQIFNGTIFWVAAIFITYLAFAMLRFKGWEAKWRRKLEEKGVKSIAKDHTQKNGAEDAAIEAGDLVDEKALAYEDEDVAPHSPSISSGPPAIPAPKLPWYKAIWFRFMAFIEDYTMFLLTFFTILREGLEAIVFLFGVGNANPAAIPISGCIGIFLGLVVGFVLYYTGRTVKDIKWLLYCMATVLFFIAAGAVSNGAHLLMLGGMYGPYYIPSYGITLTGADQGVAVITSALYGVEGAPPAPDLAALADLGFNDGDEGPAIVVNTVDDGYVYMQTHPQPWFMRPLWNICTCCSDVDTENYFLSICATLFGYRCAPCFIDAIFYMGYWWIVLVWGLWKWRKGNLLDADWKHKKMLRAQAKERAVIEQGGTFDSPSLAMPPHAMTTVNPVAGATEIAPSAEERAAAKLRESGSEGAVSSHKDSSENQLLGEPVANPAANLRGHQ